MVASQQDNNPGEVRSILLPDRRKKPQRWSQCFQRTLPKPSLHNDDQYVDPVEKHLYEEPEDREGIPRSNIQGREAEEMDELYKSVENRDCSLIYIS